MSTAIDGDAYRSLFDQNPHPMWVFDRTSLAFLAVNDAAIRQYGYSREEFLRKTILDIRPAEDVTTVKESLVSGLSQPRTWNHLRKDGSSILVEITAHDIFFAGVDARFVMAHDVTERERNASLVRRKDEVLRTVMQVAPVGILLLSSDGEVIECNEEARRLLGETGPDEISGLIDRTLEETADGLELELVPGLWSEVRSQRVVFEGESSGAILTLTDVNERRAARSRLARENEELGAAVRERTAVAQASDEELQEFCFSVSHDLRGPLRAVDGFTQSVLSDPDARLSEENRDSLLRVRRAATRMGELIDGLLVLSRVARAKMAPVELDLTSMLTRTADDLKRSNPGRSLQFDIPAEAKDFGDPALVTVLLDALLGNAVKFTAQQPDTRIEVVQDGDGWIVRDNGVGFDMAYSEKLFRPFEKLHPNAEFPGNGLGLALAARVLKRHGGSIEGQGEPGHGASFRFFLGSKENT